MSSAQENRTSITLDLASLQPLYIQDEKSIYEVDLNRTNDLGKCNKNGDHLGEGKEAQVEVLADPNLVTWNGPDDPEFPQNWPLRTKWTVTAIMSILEFITLCSSLMIAPALHLISKDLHITNDAETQLSLSAYVLAFAMGPLIFGPLSEIYGRKRIVQISNVWYLIWNMLCGFAHNEGVLVVGRLFSGAGASAIFGVGAGMLSDCWRPEQRGLSLAIYTFLPLIGPAVGPIIGGYLAESINWRWVFWASSIFDALVQLAGIFFFRETHAPTILHRRAKALRKSTGNRDLYTEHERKHATATGILYVVLTRAIIILATQHTVQIMAVYIGYNFGVMYALHSTIPLLFQKPSPGYAESVEISGLNYISMFIGFTLGSQIGAFLTDRVYAYVKAHQKGVLPRPEHRLILCIPGVILIPTGLFLYGWSAQYHLHWIVPNIGIVIFGIGTALSTACASSYVVDSAGEYTASVMAGIGVARSICGFGFPLFSPALYDRLGWGWGNTLLGFGSIVFGVLGSGSLWVCGERFRVKGRLAERFVHK